MIKLFRRREDSTNLVIGLGNHGSEYKHNRHNIGFMVMDRLAAILFRITHQSAEIQDGWLEPYRQLGFELDRQDRSTGRARIARIIAWKPRG